MPLGEPEIAAQGKVQLPRSEPFDHVSSQRALRARRRTVKRSRIQPAASRCVGLGNPQRLARYYRRTKRVTEADSDIFLALQRGHGESATRARHRIESPTAQKLGLITGSGAEGVAQVE